MNQRLLKLIPMYGGLRDLPFDLLCNVEMEGEGEVGGDVHIPHEFIPENIIYCHSCLILQEEC